MAIKAVARIRRLAGQIANSKREEQEARAAIARALKTLRPAVADAPFWNPCLFRRWLPLRPIATLAATSNNGSRPAANASRHAEQERVRHRKAHERLIADEQVVAADELERLRGRRDAGWSIIRRRHVEGAGVPEDEIASFVPLGCSRGRLRDRDAQSRMQRRIGASSMPTRPRSLRSLGGRSANRTICWNPSAWKRRRWRKNARRLDAAWAALWSGALIAPRDPDVMIEWLRARSEILELDRADSMQPSGIPAPAQQREDEAKRLVLAELDALGVSTDVAGRPAASSRHRGGRGAERTTRDRRQDPAAIWMTRIARRRAPLTRQAQGSGKSRG